MLFGKITLKWEKEAQKKLLPNRIGAYNILCGIT